MYTNIPRAETTNIIHTLDPLKYKDDTAYEEPANTHGKEVENPSPNCVVLPGRDQHQEVRMSTRTRKPLLKLSKDFFIDKHSAGILKNNNNNNNKNTKIQIFHQNLQSLNNKKLNIDVLLTWMYYASLNIGWKKKKYTTIFFVNYSLVSKLCRKNKQHRCSCIYVKENLEAKPYNLFENLLKNN
jgi:hypothetical protein